MLKPARLPWAASRTDATEVTPGHGHVTAAGVNYPARRLISTAINAVRTWFISIVNGDVRVQGTQRRHGGSPSRHEQRARTSLLQQDSCSSSTCLSSTVESCMWHSSSSGEMRLFGGREELAD